jgi:uncharacterized protein with HEPN domain
MSKRDVKAFLYDILESANDVIEFTKDIGYNEFINNKMIRYAVIRALEIIGEASRYINNDFREKYPNVPWKEMVGLRNILIHKYFGIDYILLWKIVKEDIPKIKKEVERVLKDIENEK